MQPEPEKPKEEASAPSRNVRLTWWFGIYLAGAFILPVLLILRSTHLEPLNLLLELAASSLVFPCGFLGIPDFIAALLHLHPSMPTDDNGGRAAAFVVVVFPLAYVTYITHLIYTLKAKTLRSFRFLLLGLIAIVTLNIGGCYEIGTNTGEATKSPTAAFQK